MNSNKSLKNLYQVDLVVFILCLLFNLMYPLYNDDLLRINMDVIYKGQLFQQLYYDYYHLTGRILAQVLEYIFINGHTINIMFFVVSLSAALCYTVLNRILYYFSTSKFYIIFSVFFFLYLVKVFDFKECFEFKTICVQYIWGITVYSFILFRFQSFFKEKIPSILYLALGILLSTYNEILNLLFIMSLVALFMLSGLKNKRLLVQYFAFVIGLVSGFIVMIISPGTLARKQAYVRGLTHKGIYYSNLQKILYPFIHYHHVPLKFVVTALIIILLFAALLHQILRKGQSYKVPLRIWGTIIFWIFSLLVLAPFAYTYSDRGGIWLGGRITIIADLLQYVLLWQLLTFVFIQWRLATIFKKCRFIFFYKIFWMLLCTIYFAITLVASYKEFNHNQKQISYINKTYRKEHMQFVFNSFYCISKTWSHLSLSHDSFSQDQDSSMNVEFAKFHNAYSVRQLNC